MGGMWFVHFGVCSQWKNPVTSEFLGVSQKSHYTLRLEKWRQILEVFNKPSDS